MVVLKHLNNFGRTNVTPLINCEINFILTWSENIFIIDPPVNNYNNWNKILCSNGNFINSG